MLVIPQPTQRQILHSLLSVLVSDATAGMTSLINTTLSPYGISLDGTTVSPNDATELQHIKIGTRGSLPRGLSVFLFPSPKKLRWLTTPNGKQIDYQFHVQGYWVNPPDTGPYLTETPAKLWDMFPDFCEALEVVLGPENLNGNFGGWSVPGGGTLINPFVTTATSCAWLQMTVENRQEEVYYCDLVFGGQKYA